MTENLFQRPKHILLIVDAEDEIFKLPAADVVIAARVHPSMKLAKKVRNEADIVVSRDYDQLSPFDGGTLRPLEPLEIILNRLNTSTVVVIGQGEAVKYAAFDSNALGYATIVDLEFTKDLTSEDYVALERAGIQIVGEQPQA